jgi:hypothetical protein
VRRSNHTTCTPQMSMELRGSQGIITTADGRSFPLQYFEWTEALVARGFDYDYAFDVVTKKKTFLAASEYLQKNKKPPRKIFGKKLPRYPRVTDPDIKLSGMDDDAEEDDRQSEPKLTLDDSNRVASPVHREHLEIKGKQVMTNGHDSDPDHDDDDDFEVVMRKKTPSHQKKHRASPAPSPNMHHHSKKSSTPVAAPVVVLEDDKYDDDAPVRHAAPAGPLIVVVDEADSKYESKEMLSDRVDRDEPTSAPAATSGKKSYAKALASPTNEPPADSPFRRVAASSPKTKAKVVANGFKPLPKPGFKVDDKVELLRSSGQWVEAKIVKVEGRGVVVEYRDKGLKYQKKMGMNSENLAHRGTNLKVAASPKSVKGASFKSNKGLDEVEAFNQSRRVSRRGSLNEDKLSEGEFLDNLTESTAYNPKGATMPAASMRPEDLGSIIAGSVAGTTFSGPIYMKPQNLLPLNKPTPAYKKGDLVNVKCSDGHWYRGKLLDVGEQAVLVEYKRKKEKFHKKLPIRSRLLRCADSKDVETVKAIQTAKVSSTKKVPLEMLMNKSLGDKALEDMKPAGSKTPKTAKKESAKKAEEEKPRKKSGSKMDGNASMTDSNASSSDSKSHVEILRSDGIWYEGYIVKAGAKAQIV